MNPTTSAGALEQLQGFQSSRKKPQDILKESQTRLGIPTVQQRAVGLRSAIGNTENLIRQVDPSVTGRTSGSLVSEAQRSRLVNLERAPLDDTFRTQNQALGEETSNLNTLNTNALQEAQLATSADDQRQNELQGIYSLLYQRERDAAAEAEARRQAQAQADYLSALSAPSSQEAPASTRVGLDSIFGNMPSGAPGTNVLKPNYNPAITMKQQANRDKLFTYSNPVTTATHLAYKPVKSLVNKATPLAGGIMSKLKGIFG